MYTLSFWWIAELWMTTSEQQMFDISSCTKRCPLYYVQVDVTLHLSIRYISSVLWGKLYDEWWWWWWRRRRQPTKQEDEKTEQIWLLENERLLAKWGNYVLSKRREPLTQRRKSHPRRPKSSKKEIICEVLGSHSGVTLNNERFLHVRF